MIRIESGGKCIVPPLVTVLLLILLCKALSSSVRKNAKQTNALSHVYQRHLNLTLAGLSRVSGRIKLSQSCGVAAGAALARLKATTTTTTLLHTLNIAHPRIRLLHKGLLENVPQKYNWN